jgi:ABC-type amino acid transport substrate-binding protein
VKQSFGIGISLGIVITALVFAVMTARPNIPASTSPETTYARILKTGKIRCGYFVAPPGIIKDPNTGKLSGYAYDITNAAAEKLGLSVDWSQEVDFGTMTQGLLDRRYDAVCSGVWDTAGRAREADFSIPFAYTPVMAYVRANDKRFDDNPGAINNPDVKIAVIDGENAQQIARISFPHAALSPLPQLAGVSGLLMEVASGKADMTFTYPDNFLSFEAQNPGVLRPVAMDRPLRAFGNTLMIAKNAGDLKSALDAAIRELLNEGTVDHILNNYHTGAYRVAPDYLTP